MDDNLKDFLDRAPVLLGMDFGRAESQMLISLMTAKADGTFIYTPVDPDQFYKTVERGDRISVTGSGFNLIIIDEYADFPAPMMEQTTPDAPPMKQNGRSAAYLAHDPSKRHRRHKHIRS